jgi:hypothetical protein
LHGVTHSGAGADGAPSVSVSADFFDSSVAAASAGGEGAYVVGGAAAGGGGGAVGLAVVVAPLSPVSGTPSTCRHRSMSATAPSMVVGVGPSGANAGA